MGTKLELFKELIEISRNENRGLTIYTNGQTIVGVVTKIHGAEAIELRSQMFRKAIVLLNKIDAMAVS